MKPNKCLHWSITAATVTSGGPTRGLSVAPFNIMKHHNIFRLCHHRSAVDQLACSVGDTLLLPGQAILGAALPEVKADRLRCANTITALQPQTLLL